MVYPHNVDEAGNLIDSVEDSVGAAPSAVQAFEFAPQWPADPSAGVREVAEDELDDGWDYSRWHALEIAASRGRHDCPIPHRLDAGALNSARISSCV